MAAVPSNVNIKVAKLSAAPNPYASLVLFLSPLVLVLVLELVLFLPVYAVSLDFP